MDDYYELLGVDADAPVNDIRAAYRDKKAAVADTGTEQAKADAAALNKAWNVLSDPYQRGRYDQQLADTNGADSDDDDAEDDSDAAPPARSRRAKSNPRADARNAARTAKPTVKLPAGMAFPSNRKRRTAMFIDLAVLLALFLASQFLVISLEKSNHRFAYDKVTQLNGSGSGSISKAHAATSAANKAKTAADAAYTNLAKTKGANAPDTQNAKAKSAPADAAAKAAKASEDALNKQLTHYESILAPLSNLISGGYFVLSLFILIIPSLFGGATFGKRTQHVRVVRLDGSPARAMDIFRRYAVLVFAAYVLTLFLRSPVGAVIVVFIVSISRNPNSQALHDRFAKTLVVTDADE
jgi:curved DNA-binding protein CbpA